MEEFTVYLEGKMCREPEESLNRRVAVNTVSGKCVFWKYVGWTEGKD